MKLAAFSRSVNNICGFFQDLLSKFTVFFIILWQNLHFSWDPWRNFLRTIVQNDFFLRSFVDNITFEFSNVWDFLIFGNYCLNFFRELGTDLYPIFSLVLIAWQNFYFFTILCRKLHFFSWSLNEIHIFSRSSEKIDIFPSFLW